MPGGRMQESIATHSTTVRIAATHPSLPGHFPGRPLVPGVLLLDEVLNAAELWLHGAVRVRSLRQAKFTAPLLPDQSADLQLTLQGTALRFQVARGDQMIAQGVLEVAIEAAMERGA
jgi:3-hydroxymyristoyl/3-hydroxydecanoyl-(acyl carrier protein) dehydratase